MRLLVVTPDYASHYYPLSAVAAAWQEAGGRARRAGLAEVIDPNRSSLDEIAAAVEIAFEGMHRSRAARLGADLRADPGNQRAVRLCRDLLP